MYKDITLSILKPDAVRRNVTGKVNSLIEAAGLKIIAQKMILLSVDQAKRFYQVHAERPFYGDLVKSMTSGPVIVQVLKGDNAVSHYRQVMGATNPKDAEVGTIRKELALNIEENTVHGSDSEENAINEIAFFFSKIELVNL